MATKKELTKKEIEAYKAQQKRNIGNSGSWAKGAALMYEAIDELATEGRVVGDRYTLAFDEYGSYLVVASGIGMRDWRRTFKTLEEAIQVYIANEYAD